MQQMTHYTALSEDQARAWLLANDVEGSDQWRTATEGLIQAVADNLSDYGEAFQDGELHVTICASQEEAEEKILVELHKAGFLCLWHWSPNE